MAAGGARAAGAARCVLAALLCCPECVHGAVGHVSNAVGAVGDVLNSFEEIGVIGIVCVVLAIAYYMRRRILFLLTGDDKLHCTPETTFYRCCCLCCNTCTGDWTRCLTNFTWVPHRYRNRNLVQVFGQGIGLKTHPVEIGQIVVGNLPFEGRGDFYLDVENDLNPAMVTSVAEGANPRIVKFPEVFTIRVRKQLFRQYVVISVKELNVVGHQKLCSLSVAHSRLLDWASEGGIRRLEMQVASWDEFESPPWIMFEASFPELHVEAEELIAENNLLIHDRSMDELPQTDHVDNPNGTVSVTHSRSFFLREASLSEVKSMYPLKTPAGHRVDEPDESELWRFQREKALINACVSILVAVVVSVLIAYWCFRSFIMDCHDQIKIMLVEEKIDNGTVNLSNDVTNRLARYDFIELQCSKNVTKGLALLGDDCNPWPIEVTNYCRQLQREARPCAYEHLIYKHMGTVISIPFLLCTHCTERRWDIYDKEAAVITVVLLIGLYLCQQLAHWFKHHEMLRWRSEHSHRKNEMLSRLNSGRSESSSSRLPRAQSSRRGSSPRSPSGRSPGGRSVSPSGSLRSNSRMSSIFKTARQLP